MDVIREAAEQGDAEAQYKLGIAYSHGQGIPENPVEAVKWFRRAAEQGHEKAQFSLGFRYNFGQGVDKNEVEAIKWYRRAAEQGNAEADSRLEIILRQQKENILTPPRELDRIKVQDQAAESSIAPDTGGIGCGFLGVFLVVAFFVGKWLFPNLHFENMAKSIGEMGILGWPIVVVVGVLPWLMILIGLVMMGSAAASNKSNPVTRIVIGIIGFVVFSIALFMVLSA